MDRLANIYELLEDENDDQRQKKSAPQAQKPKAPGPGAPVKNQPAQKNQPAADQKGKPKGGEQNKLDRRMGVAANAEAPKGNRPPRQQREHREPREPREDRPKREGQRQFERRSGTGRPQGENKRGGAGKGNWGTVEDDKQAQTEQAEKVEGQPAEGAAAPAENKEAEAKVEVEAVPEEEDKTKTLDEYFKGLKQPVVALPPPRQVDAGKGFEGLVPLKRDLEAEQAQKKDKKKEDEKEDSSKKTIPADQLLNFSAEHQTGFRGKGRGRGGEGRGGESPRGGRGGRGAKRGGGGGGPKGPAPKFDESSFPTLAATKA